MIFFWKLGHASLEGCRVNKGRVKGRERNKGRVNKGKEIKVGKVGVKRKLEGWNEIPITDTEIGVKLRSIIDEIEEWQKKKKKKKKEKRNF